MPNGWKQSQTFFELIFWVHTAQACFQRSWTALIWSDSAMASKEKKQGRWVGQITARRNRMLRTIKRDQRKRSSFGKIANLLQRKEEGQDEGEKAG